MQLGLYRTTLTPAARLFNEFGVLRFGKMISRSAGSRADGNSVNSRNNFTANERGQPGFFNSSTSYENDFPPLSANKISQRRRRIDLTTFSKKSSEGVKNIEPLQLEASNLGTCSEQKLEVVQNISPLQLEASNLSTCSKQESKVAPNIGPLKCEASTSLAYQYDTDLPINFWEKKPLYPSRDQNLHQTHQEHQEAKIRSKPYSSTPIDEPFDICPPEEQSIDENEQKKGDAKKGNNTEDLVESISDHYNTDLPTSFGKKKPLSSSRNPKFHRTRQEHQEVKRRSKHSSSTPIDEPFDICPPETTESTSSGSYVNQRNRGMWVPKEQSAEENEQNKGDTEKGNNAEDLVEESGLILRPGMVLFKHYIPPLEQENIVNRCRDLGRGPGGFYQPGYNDGAKLRLHMMCLGLDWNPQTKSYGKRRHHDNAVPPELPHEFTSLVCRVLDDSHTLIKRNMKVKNVEDVLPIMYPDVCIVNFYTTNGRLGLHQDRDESWESLDEGLPVVSISIGDSAEFLYGDQRDVNKAESVLLESGDVLIFGGESRHIYHGVKAIIPDSAPLPLLQSTNLRPGRLNLTFRQY
ncbi:2-oxoglutarate-dependent dioxygenase family protein [Perilla frutescens var. hirtella]|nr:2-oxoglutarate-dependent dioxygenase family protein [Perilla frutescens var. frutescens]KAH6786994.1 2-oxoglutarate-dependent dioxygenase family protein [Perilla frutescens var. hirtella]